MTSKTAELGKAFLVEREKLIPTYNALADQVAEAFKIINAFYQKTGNNNGRYNWARTRHFASFQTDDVEETGITFLGEYEDYYISFEELDNISSYLETEEKTIQYRAEQARINNENVLVNRKVALLEELAEIESQLLK